MGTEPDLGDVAAIVRRHLPHPEFRAYLFGSRAAGRARRGADWDIGILGPLPVRGAVLEAVREDLEALPTLHSFDVVDLTAADADFRAAALRTAIPLP